MPDFFSYARLGCRSPICKLRLSSRFFFFFFFSFFFSEYNYTRAHTKRLAVARFRFLSFSLSSFLSGSFSRRSVCLSISILYDQSEAVVNPSINSPTTRRNDTQRWIEVRYKNKSTRFDISCAGRKHLYRKHFKSKSCRCASIVFLS